MRRHVGREGLSPADFRRPVVTIGVFDGMHRGHRHVVEHLRAMADRLDGEAVVLTFDTHPRAVLEGAAPRRILSMPHRLLLLERNGVDATVVLPFDDAMRDTTYADFTRDVLVGGLGIAGLLFGYNGNFGAGGEGTVDRLRPLGLRARLRRRGGARRSPSTGAPSPPAGSATPSSRATFHEAETMLGRPVALYGRVVAGDGRGRSLGFPTANVDPEGEILPPRGVYQVIATIGDEHYAAVANVGLRPTFGAAAEPGAPRPRGPRPRHRLRLLRRSASRSSWFGSSATSAGSPAARP